MDDFFTQIVGALNAGLYYLALTGALMIPDFCGALESADGEATGPRYEQWFNTHVAPLHRATWPGGDGTPILDGDTCWKFRCSLLHQGRTAHPRSRYKRVMFLEPGGIVAHMNVMTDPTGSTLNLDIPRFCVDMVNAARTWQGAVAGTEPYETNLNAFVRRYPDGLAPLAKGHPVIA